jgi:hypothetical protein
VMRIETQELKNKVTKIQGPNVYLTLNININNCLVVVRGWSRGISVVVWGNLVVVRGWLDGDPGSSAVVQGTQRWSEGGSVVV